MKIITSLVGAFAFDLASISLMALATDYAWRANVVTQLAWCHDISWSAWLGILLVLRFAFSRRPDVVDPTAFKPTAISEWSNRIAYAISTPLCLVILSSVISHIQA